MSALPSIDEARARVLAAVSPLPTEVVPVADALDRVLAEDVVAAADVPAFANSAVDGFAVRAHEGAASYALVGESRAGRPSSAEVGPGEAVRISTGAALPAGAEGVVMLERSAEPGDGTVALDAGARTGDHVRGAGEDVRAGATVLRAGTLLGPTEIGVAVVAGRGELRCARRPRVAVLATGDELRPPGTPLGPGELHDSNSVGLAALARRAGAEVVLRRAVGDTPEATRAAVAEARAAIAAALGQADVLVLSGGVSVGPHDHVKPALEAEGVRQGFWRVALRPGKPTWFGTRGEQLVFGLPGNPVSAMVCFLLFARPALRALVGAPAGVPRGRARLAVAIPRHPDRDECVRVTLRDGIADPTGAQGSHRLTSMLGADAYALVLRGAGEAAAGEEVDVELLPA